MLVTYRTTKRKVTVSLMIDYCRTTISYSRMMMEILAPALALSVLWTGLSPVTGGLIASVLTVLVVGLVAVVVGTVLTYRQIDDSDVEPER